MKSIKLATLSILVMIVLGVLFGCGKDVSYISPTTNPCESYHFVDVYVNEKLQYVTLENDQEIGTILVYPCDFLYINNLSKDKVIIDLAPGVFETDELKVTIAGNKRVKLRVRKEAVVADSFKSSKGDIIKDGIPKVRVGEDP